MYENFEQFLELEYPARKHEAHAVYTEADMKKAFLSGLEKLHHKQLYEDYKDDKGITANQRYVLSCRAKHIQGNVNGLVCAQTNGIGLPNIRKVIENIYQSTDHVLELVDEIEKEIKKRKAV